MAPPRTATACATVSRASTVRTLALRTTRSAASPSPVTFPPAPARGLDAAAAAPRSPAISSAAGRRSAAPGVGDPEAQAARRRIVLEVVAGALEARRRGEQREDGVAVRRPLVVLRPVGVHEALDRGERGLVGGEPGVLERALLLELLDRLRGGAEVAPEQAAGDRHDHQHDQDLDEPEPAFVAEASHGDDPTRPS